DWHVVSGCRRLLAGAYLPYGVFAEVVGGRAGRDRRGVVRSHHQDDHVVDDVVDAELLSVTGRRLALTREQVRPLGLARRGKVSAEVLVQRLPALVSRAETGAGQGVAHAR